VENRAADALSCKVSLLSAMRVNVTSFNKLKEEYERCPDFGDIYATLQVGPSIDYSEYLLQDGYLFRGQKLCIPRTSVRELLV